MAYRTKYKPKNPQKYVGDVSNIVCRSLWERNVCKFLDENHNIIKWSSEELAIPYTSPLDGKLHNYYPDFIVQFKNNTKINNWIVEIKPKKQTVLKENASKSEKTIWAINSAKWKAANAYCEKNNMEFKILTEKELFTNA